MALHHSLRDLVSVRGAGVVDEAEEFRGVLDDFLAEDEATLGELNLLVDAVRLGALRRVLDVMDHGAAPQAAIREAGAALARDRGTDDPTRSCWALASLGFALGKVDESTVRTFLGDTGTMSAPSRPVPPIAPAPDPVATGPTTAERPTTEALPDGAAAAAPPAAQPGAAPSPAPPTAAPQPAPYAGPVPPVIPEQRSSRAGVYLLILLVALLLGGLIATGIILLRSDDPTASDEPTSDAPDAGESAAKALVPRSAMLVPYVVDNISRIYQVDTLTGESEPMTSAGVDARLPTISPDRRTMTYQLGAPPSVVRSVDLETGEERDLFDADGDCGTAGRPAWSPDGSRFAVVCSGIDKVVDGIWVANADGSGLTEVVPDPDVNGSPTWISDTEFVFPIEEVESAPLTFWKSDADGSRIEQMDVELDGFLSHADWSPTAERLIFLVSPDAEMEGAVWTVDVDGEDAELVADGSYAHPVWSPDGDAIGVTSYDEEGEESLAYIPLDDPENPVIVPDPPPGDIGVPVWGTR
ncbi:TolB family protein [Nocardioides bizhenqiangii]|uniref:WD40 repeat domain-containing protein n=1 Tax=Nocardioides bizhenqiangii TaxID=3095076 RepID=A0ABZ0ZWE0_9ACTN|nr:hypothetical protein [Nocardioides sp. HM61]WQQ28672.1 hypothetical protein SHK19_10670 [Nocardioides sp. HM61]